MALVCDEVEHVDTAADDIVVQLPTSAMIVAGSAGHLRRVVRNLLDNAVRHARSRVEVHLDHLDGQVVLRVIDDGPGIPVEDRPRVLQPFVRLDTARNRDTGGTGLGLAIVDEIVRAHHGELALDDARPTGLTVVVRLPAGVRTDSAPGEPMR